MELKSEKQFKRLNRAQDFFGDPVKRWENWKTFVRQSKAEKYLSFGAAIVCHLKSSGDVEFGLAGSNVHVKVGSLDDGIFLVLKHHATKPHELKHWDDELVFVDNVEVVNGPEGIIPSLVGFYRIEHQRCDPSVDFLLFQSTIDGCFKFLPRVLDWKPCVLIDRHLGVPVNGLGPQNIESTLEIVEYVADHHGKMQGNLVLDGNGQAVCPVVVFMNGNRVEVRLHESLQNRIELIDVFMGPYNLEP